jgi:exodeoxyribonuclease V beta subunit
MSAAVFLTPLDTLGLIEASAGTGKTYTLAGLFARAVIVQRLAVPQVLAVTYTVAATQELHERVRLRLLDAAELAAQWQADDPAERDGDDAGTAVLRALIHTALADGNESLPALRRRLARASRAMDQAVITTIHGFCQRVLGEHALETGQVLQPAEVVTSLRQAHEAIALELWRAWGANGEDAAWLRANFDHPEGLADALSGLLGPEPLRPPAPEDARARRDAAWAAMLAEYARCGEPALDRIGDAVADKVLSSAKDKIVPVAELRAWFAMQAADSPAPPAGALELITPAALRKACLKNKEDRCPASPLFEAVDRFLFASEALHLHRLHALRAQAMERDQARKQALQQRGFDDLIAAMHAAVVDPIGGPALRTSVRKQFPLALVDEFQDTDARQWTIFRTLFGDGGLLLVGDPKQAIYRFRGGDVHTYRLARSQSAIAPPLQHNFRSRPCVLEAVNALFAQPHLSGEALGEGIAFAATEPGGNVPDEAFLIDGAPAPALTFHELPGKPAKGAGKPPGNWNKPESIDRASLWCAQRIRDLLHLASQGRAQRLDDGRLRAIEPRDCAVLVRTHDEAVAVRAALARVGVPAVAAGRQSLFATTQAQELLTLLLALSTPGDERRLRAALATRLLGRDAQQLQVLESGGEAMQAAQRDFAQWRLRWEQHGPQAMLADVLALQAPRLLAEFDGERQLTSLLQLGELLQEARAQRLGPQGQIDWLHAAIANADRDDVEQQPRLESDASRVQILTLHVSKGLEFPLVFLPFAAIGRDAKPPKQALFHEDGAFADGDDLRVRQWKTDYDHPGALPWKEACSRHLAEESGEDMRLLYVGLTRARDALWVCGGALSNHASSALGRLLAGPKPSAQLIDALGLEMHDGLPDPADDKRLPPIRQDAVPAPLVAQRTLPRDWWIHSFSQLHRQKPHGARALVEETAAADERPLATAAVATDAPIDPRFRGERFGNAVHHALEHVDFARWSGCDGSAPPPEQRQVLIDALDSQGYASDDHADGVRELARLVADTLNAPLPEGGRLCELPAGDRVAEIEFHFTLADTDTGALLALLHRHGIVRERSGFGAWPRLSGLMNGKIDLTYRRDGRAYVLDYKSNLLPDYDRATMDATMRASEYDLQALLYVIALHRWLRLRREHYDIGRDIGGVRYLFCRGLRAGDLERGMMAFAFEPALIEAVDALLSLPGGRA